MMPKMTKMQGLLIAQLVWLFMAIGYNVIGIWRMQNGLNALIGTRPEYALLSLCVFAVVIYLGFSKRNFMYLLSILLTLPGLIYIGIGRHIEAYILDNSLPNYAGYWAWVWAIGINVYGVLVFALSVPGLKQEKVSIR
jgi:hypothetical protein